MEKFLSREMDYLDGSMDDVKKEYKSSDKYLAAVKKSISSGRWLRISLWILFGMLGLLFVGGLYEGTTNDVFFNTTGLEALSWFREIVILISLMVWTGKTYKPLIIAEKKDLSYQSAVRPIWGWICPIAFLYVPLKTLRDIFRGYSEEVAQDACLGMLGWFFALRIISHILLRISDRVEFVAILGGIIGIIAYILLLILVNHLLDIQQEIVEKGCKRK